ncbi:transporter [Frondihabitans sp. PAMC 28766]|uniref:RDD family protein n=1 Tax=Frondihabitans sp. PAMC 28766 TaxID=1795630 RepID=UPI00078DC355|nr:RDD family protein [Frondihabitans sp. PAMC 28766]AMM20953.1 transporter [Frondihabitans sp. PAMC 28766]
MSSSAPPPFPDAPRERPPWPGHDLGLPQTGPRSIARFGRRLIAIFIDWAIAVVISIAFFHYNSFATLGVFFVEQALFLILIGGSPGHLIVRLRLVPARGGRLVWWKPLIRTFLLCLVVPAVIYDRDQRGLHDRAVDTFLVRI